VGENRGSLEAELRTVSRAVAKIRDELRRLADDNIFTIDYLVSQPAPKEDDGATNGSSGLKSIAYGEVQIEGEDENEDDDAEWIGLD
jgi:periodic tryptophan protein 2